MICIIVFTVMLIAFVVQLLIQEKSKNADIEAYGHENRRNTFRIQYKQFQRPKLIIENNSQNNAEDQSLEVLNVSEEGLCFVGEKVWPKKETIVGKIQFRYGDTEEVAGKVVHQDSDKVHISLLCSIPYSLIIKEQRHIISDKKAQNIQRSNYKKPTDIDDSGFRSRQNTRICLKGRI
jgi:hypothetical protein